MGNENSHKIPHINIRKKRLTTSNNLKYLELMPRSEANRKVHVIEKDKEININKNFPYSFSGKNDNKIDKQRFNILSSKNVKNIKIKMQNKQFDFYTSKIRHTSQPCPFLKESDRPLSSFGSYLKKTPAKTFTIIKSFNFTSPKTYLKIKSPKITLNSNKNIFYTFKPSINSQVRYNPCSKININTPVRSKIMAKQEKKVFLHCLSNQIMDELNDQTPTIKQKILNDKKKQIEETKQSRINKRIHCPPKHRISSANFKARFFKEDSKNNIEGNDNKKKELSVFSGCESEEKGKDSNSKKDTLKVETEINIPYQPTPTFLYKWEGQEGPLNNQSIKDYYNLLCV